MAQITFVPRSRPGLLEADARVILAQYNIADMPALLGIRGYYLDTMGEPGKNDRAIYDDAIIIVSQGFAMTFNANTDAGAYRRGIANLKPGVWLYKLGIHGLSKPQAQQYEALVQAAPVTVQRDQVGDDTGWFGINIHRGSYRSTSSLGCQTIYPAQWQDFISTVKEQLRRLGKRTIPYVLIDETTRKSAA